MLRYHGTHLIRAGFIGVVLTTIAGGAFFFYPMVMEWLLTEKPFEVPAGLMDYLLQTHSLTGQPHLYAKRVIQIHTASSYDLNHGRRRLPVPGGTLAIQFT